MPYPRRPSCYLTGIWYGQVITSQSTISSALPEQGREKGVHQSTVHSKHLPQQVGKTITNNHHDKGALSEHTPSNKSPSSCPVRVTIPTKSPKPTCQSYLLNPVSEMDVTLYLVHVSPMNELRRNTSQTTT